MRKLAALSLLALSLLVCSHAFAQTKVPLKNALDEVTRVFGTKFVFERSVIANKTTDVDVASQKGKPVEAVLKNILYPNNLLFLYVDVNHYTIVKNDQKNIRVPDAQDAPAPVNDAPRPGEQQDSSRQMISGIVVGSDNVPLSGVSVTADNGGTITDAKGQFTMNARLGEIVTLTSVGYQPLSVRIRDSKLRLQMLVDQKQIDEVVVIAYGTQNKKDLTGSVSTISGKDIADLPPTVNIEEALQGRAAGVLVVQESGQPGGATRVRIRGSSSLLGSNQPLYVVDGIPVTVEGNIPDDGSTLRGVMLNQGLSSPLGNINPDDIESITVLKDASATAIYGSRAANGVVVITTKLGKGKPVYNFSTSLSYQEAQTEKMLNAQQFRELWTEAANNSTSTAAIVQDIKNGTYFGDANTDWAKEVTPGNPLTKNVTFSVSGGTDKVRYYTAIGLQDQTGGFESAYFNRYNFLVNLNFAASKIINLGTSINLSSSTQGSPDASLLSRIYSFRPDLPVYNADGNYSFSNYHNFENPVALATATNKNKTGLLLGSIFGEIRIAKDFLFKSSLAVNYNQGRQRSFYPSHTGTGGFTRNGPGPGYAQESSSESYSTLWENTLAYNKTFNKHTVDGVLGASWQGDNTEFLSASGKGFPQDFTLTNLSSATQDFTIASRSEQSGLISFFGRVNYQYDNKYMLTLSARSDGSSKFASENKWAFFPTVAAAWRLSEENFLRSVNFINDLKIRASIGMTGQQNFGAYQWRTLFEAANYGGMPAVTQNQLGNSRLKWELTRQTDIGLDFSLFDGRLSGTFDYYEKNTTDLLYFYKAPGNVGFTTVIGNLGNTRNTGIEIALDGDIIRNRNFSWNLGLNLANNRNRLVKLNDDFLSKTTGYITPPNTGSILGVGQPIGLIYGYVAEGIFQTSEEIEKLNAGAASGYYQAAATAPGDIKFKDIDGDGRVTTADQTIIGNAVPDFSGGINNTLAYKGIRLSALFTYSIGNDLRWGTMAQAINYNSAALENKMVIALDRWTPERPGNMPRAVYGDPNGNGKVSSFYVFDGSFLRLKNVHLSYNLPPTLLRATRFIRSAMIFVSGTNLLTFTDYPGANPETSNIFNDDVSTGLDNSRFPISKVYSAGVKIGF